MRSGFRWYDGFIILLFFYLLVLQVQEIWPFTIDDMYISLRYAKNWAAGDGLLWNINSPPVEGYSNFSFVALAALTHILNGNPIVVLKMAGYLGLLITCLFIYLISRFWFDKRESLIPCVALLLYKGNIVWATSGLETAVYQALISGAVFFSLRGLGYQLFPAPRTTSNSLSFALAGLMLSLAGMTRPEAPALMILFFGLIWWDRPLATAINLSSNPNSRGLTAGSIDLGRKLISWVPRSSRGNSGWLNLMALRPSAGIKHFWHGVLAFMITILAVFAPYFIWRWHYYGYLFPNSVYCKAFSTQSYVLAINYLKLIWPFATLAVVASIRRPDKRYYFLWMPSLVYLFMLKDADPIVAFFNRLFLPAFVLMLPLALIGLNELCSLVVRKQRRSLMLCATSFALLVLFMPWMTLAQYGAFTRAPLAGETLRAQVVEWLHQHARRGDKVVIGDAGMIPYYSPLHVVDSYCLNNKAMAHYSESERYERFCHEIINQKPAIIILTSLVEQGKTIYTPSDLCLREVIKGYAEYKATKTVTSPHSDSMYRYELFTNF